MKKNYKQPEITIVAMDTENIMAGASIGGDPAPGDLAPEHKFSSDNDFDGKEKDVISGPSNSISTDKMNDYSIKR